jgi:hypothetical protein
LSFLSLAPRALLACKAITRGGEKDSVPKSKAQPAWESIDLIVQILDVWQLQQVNPFPKHVYGHQDDKSIGPLSFVEYFNLKMNKLAICITIRHFTMALRTLLVSTLGLESSQSEDIPSPRLFRNQSPRGYITWTWLPILQNKWEPDEQHLTATVHWRCLAKARQ